MANHLKEAIKNTANLLNIWLPHKIQYDHIPGLSVGIVYHGDLIYKQGFGFADLENKVKAQPYTNYRIASISKTFTAIAILQLMEQGKLNLHDKVQKYLPWFKVKNKNTNAANITIQQLLSHTAGVFRDGNTSHWTNDHFPNLYELKQSISDHTLVFENLTRFKYSNFGFALLGEIIHKASGLSFEKYIEKNILKELDMDGTSTDFSSKTDPLAQGYSRMIPGKKREIFPHIRTNAYAPATGFTSNVLDLTKYLAALSLNNPKLLNRETKKEMFREYWSVNERGDSYGLGFSIHKIGRHKLVGHGGGFAGFITRMDYDPENDLGVITLTNTNDSTAAYINDGIFETIYNFSDLSKSKRSQKKLNLSQYEGAYRSRWGDELIAAFGDNLIAFDPRVNSPLKDGTVLKPYKKHRFLIESKFNFDFQGELATFTFKPSPKPSQKVSQKSSQKIPKQKAISLIWGTSVLERI